jgi:hypothetical protein
MTDDDRPAPGRHAASRPVRGRRAPLLLSLATAVGIWLGVSAPEVSPVTPPAPPATTPAGAQPGDAP